MFQQKIVNKAIRTYLIVSHILKHLSINMKQLKKKTNIIYGDKNDNISDNRLGGINNRKK